MTLAEVPVLLILVGLAAYAVLGGADFGAGFWQLLGGRGERDKALREHAHHAVGPVWEANHVWLIFVLVVCWTAYPTAFGSIASTLAVPLFIAGIGIILRGTAYALRSGAGSAREQRRIELTTALSSILTPFALAAVIGGIASGRVPVGNASGDLVTSWINPTSLILGLIAVATAAYLAAVYLAADAVRIGRPELEDAFRTRALVMSVIAGAAALAGLAVVHSDAHRIWHGLTRGAGLAAVIVSALAGAGTIAFVLRRRDEPARMTAATAVAAIIAGWGLRNVRSSCPDSRSSKPRPDARSSSRRSSHSGSEHCCSCRRWHCSMRWCCGDASTKRRRRSRAASPVVRSRRCANFRSAGRGPLPRRRRRGHRPLRLGLGTDHRRSIPDGLRRPGLRVARDGHAVLGGERLTSELDLRRVDRHAAPQLGVVAQELLVEVVQLARAGDRGAHPDARVVRLHGVAADEQARLVVLPADEHVEVDVGDAVAIAQAPGPAASSCSRNAPTRSRSSKPLARTPGCDSVVKKKGAMMRSQSGRNVSASQASQRR